MTNTTNIFRENRDLARQVRISIRKSTALSAAEIRECLQKLARHSRYVIPAQAAVLRVGISERAYDALRAVVARSPLSGPHAVGDDVEIADRVGAREWASEGEGLQGTRSAAQVGQLGPGEFAPE